MAKSVRIFDVYWSPTGQKIATVEASTAKIAKSKAPMPYRKYKGEIYVEDRGEKSAAGPNLFDRTSNSRRRRKNGRSYARKGVSIGVPRYSFDPRPGDQFYVSGKLVTIKRKDHEGMLWFNKSVDGTVAMSESNLYQASYVPEDSRFAPYEYRIKKNPTPVKLKVGRKIYNGMAKKVNGRVKVYVTPQVARKINPSGNYSTTQIDTSKDFHTLSSREVEAVLAEADRQKYRKPKNASGSRARYFFQKLQREAARSKR